MSEQAPAGAIDIDLPPAETKRRVVAARRSSSAACAHGPAGLRATWRRLGADAVTEGRAGSSGD
jgi:hypothetical protein